MRRTSVIALYAFTLFLSASLLFLVQPMVSKSVLPLLGGTPAVWNTCMLFFQAALLAGYAYSYATSRWLSVHRQTLVHAGLLALSLLALPVGLASSGRAPPADGSPVAWLMLVLAGTLGAPFVMLATSAPLLQKWFARSGHPSAANPYFLYSASNVGSMAALIAYPLLVEPRLTIAQQFEGWRAAYWLLALLVVACAIQVWRADRRGGDAPSQPVDAPLPHGAAGHASTTAVADSYAVTPPPDAATRIRWVLLAFAPVSLMLGMTVFFTTDIAAVPLLWVIPLAVYLLTFVISFSRRPVLRHSWMVAIQPLVVTVLVLQAISYVNMANGVLGGMHLLAFFLTAMVCHGELARTRPPVSHLAEFYLWIALGGVLGGIFNAIIAPTAFNLLIEYPLVMILALLLRPTLAPGRPGRSRWLDLAIPQLLAAALWALFTFVGNRPADYGPVGYAIMLGVVACVCLALQRRPVRFGLAVGWVLLVGALARHDRSDVILADRTFFGTYTVRRMEPQAQHVLSHGTTVHGAQSLDPEYRQEPLTYYHRESPLGQVFAALPDSAADRAALVGLGTGSIAAYGRPGARWTFFEVDPRMERLARDSTMFTYLRDSRAAIDVVLGDARLTLGSMADGQFDLIVLDAFTSDAIPIHLITREAVGVYLSKLARDGLVIFHISNRYLNLQPVLAELAADAGLVAAVQSDDQPVARDGLLKYGSTWVVMARTMDTLRRVASSDRWRALAASNGMSVWTDDFSNILSVLKWRLRS